MQAYIFSYNCLKPFMFYFAQRPDQLAPHRFWSEYFQKLLCGGRRTRKPRERHTWLRVSDVHHFGWGHMRIGFVRDRFLILFSDVFDGLSRNGLEVEF